MQFITKLLNLDYDINFPVGPTALMIALQEHSSSEFVDFLVANGAQMTSDDWESVVGRFIEKFDSDKMLD